MLNPLTCRARAAALAAVACCALIRPAAAADDPLDAAVLKSTKAATVLAAAEVTFRYLGVRTIGGRVEAVVKGDGTLRGRKGEGLNLAGKMEVQASIDVESGQVVTATARVDVDLDLTEDGGSGLASGVYSVSLRRAPAKAPAKP